MLRDRFAEGPAHLRVAERVLERGIGEADAAGRDVDPAELEPGHDLDKAVALRAADQATLRHAVVLEEQLGGIAAVVAELLQPAADPEARPLLGEEQRHAAMARRGVGIGLDQERKAGAFDRVGDPGLGAIDHVLVAGADGAGADRLQVGAAVRLGQRQAAAQLATGKARQEMPLLRLGAEALDQGRHDQVRIEGARQRDPGLRDQRDHAGIGRGRHAEAAVARRDGRAEQAERLHLLDHRSRVDVVVLELQHLRADVALQPLVERIQDLLVVPLGQSAPGAFGRRRGHHPALKARPTARPRSCPRSRARAWGSASCA